MDPGTRRNAWTLAVAGKRWVDGRIKVVVLHVAEWRGTVSQPLKPEVVLQAIAEIVAPYRLHHLHTDHWSVDALAAVGRMPRTVRVGVEDVAWPLYLMPWRMSSSERVKAYDTLRIQLETQLVELPPVRQVRSDLLAVRKIVTRNGLTVELVETTDGRHADYAPAVLLAVERAAVLPDPPSLVAKTEDEKLVELDRPRKMVPYWQRDPAKRKGLARRA